jgi:hypothetical protein
MASKRPRWDCPVMPMTMKSLFQSGTGCRTRCHCFPTSSSTSSTPFHQYLRIDRVAVAPLLFKTQHSALLLAFLPSILLASVGAYIVMHRRPLHAPPGLARPPSCSHYPSLQPVISRQTSARFELQHLPQQLPSDSRKSIFPTQVPRLPPDC